MQKITPFLWFNDQAEEAMNHYLGIFKQAQAGEVLRGADGKVFSVSFEIEGQPFMALNGGPQFSFTPAISLFVDCSDQAEVDRLWEQLSEGGRTDRCGWLQDKFGLSWQIVPSVLKELLYDPDPATAQRVMQAMLAMTKLDIAALQAAHAG